MQSTNVHHSEVESKTRTEGDGRLPLKSTGPGPSLRTRTVQLHGMQTISGSDVSKSQQSRACCLTERILLVVQTDVLQKFHSPWGQRL